MSQSQSLPPAARHAAAASAGRPESKGTTSESLPPSPWKTGKFLTGLIVGALLLGIPGRSAEADRNAPTDEQVAAAVVATERLLDMRRSVEALAIIKPVAEARPDSNQATFSMGLAALAAADAAVQGGAKPNKPPAKENFDLAVHSFRGILVKEPENLRVRLELARSLFSRGVCVEPPRNLFKHMLGDDCWAAEQHFVRVLGAKVPPQVVLNVRRFIQICRARKRASGNLSLALAPDTNVNTSTSAQTVDIFGLPFQLDDAARAKSGIGVVGSLSTEIQRPLPHLKWLPRGATNLRVGGLVFRREYSGGQFNDYNYGIYAGPRILTNRGHYSVLFQADRRGVNGSPYSRQYGLQLEGVRMVMPRIWAGGSVELSRQTALSLGGPVGKAGFSWNSQAFVNYTVLPSLTVRFMGGSGRENTDRISTRHRSKWVGVLGSYDLPLGFTLTAAQQLFLTQFEQPLALFGPDPPNTKLWFSRLQVHNRLIQLGGFSPSLSFIREARRANLTIYSYERYRMEGGFVRVF